VNHHNPNPKCKSNLRISLTKKKRKKKDLSGGLEESGDEKAGGRERKREEERTGSKSTYSGRISLCIWPEIRSGMGFGRIRLEIQPSALDPTSVMSPTPCPDLVVPFPSPISVAGRREKKKNERERER
jgi:hypothetical protein